MDPFSLEHKWNREPKRMMRSLKPESYDSRADGGGKEPYLSYPRDSLVDTGRDWRWKVAFSCRPSGL